jgi:hypothetical protein
MHPHTAYNHTEYANIHNIRYGYGIQLIEYTGMDRAYQANFGLIGRQDASYRSLSSRDRSDGRENSSFSIASGAGKRYRRGFCQLAPCCELGGPPELFNAVTIEFRAFRRSAVLGSSPV